MFTFVQRALSFFWLLNYDVLGIVILTENLIDSLLLIYFQY